MEDRVVARSTKRITQEYKAGVHKGVDIGWVTNEEENKIYANCKGVVIATDDGLGNMEGSTGWGNYVLVKHPNGMCTRYAHLQKNLPVKEGQEVDENTVIGIMGNTGRSYGRHLHFEVQTNESSLNRIDPTPYLSKAVYEEKPAEPTKFEIGDKVIVNGDLYVTANSEKPNGYITNRETVITRIAEGTKHPYNTKGDLGWMDEKDIELVEKQIIYVVQKGDNLSSIAAKYNMTWQDIYEDNMDIIGSNPNIIIPGQKLIIK